MTERALQVGDMVVYRLRYSLEHSDCIGVVTDIFEFEAQSKGKPLMIPCATVMWIEDGVPVFKDHNHDALIIIEDEEQARKIKEDRCRGIE